MQVAERIGYVIVGLLIGGSLSGAAALQGQTFSKPEPRIQVMQTNFAGNHSFSFVKDSKTGACWLMANTATDSGMNRPVTLAPAPKEACQME